MKFLADVNLELSVIEEIKLMGYEVVWVVDLDPKMRDSELLEFAEREGYILITNDKDFGELIFRQRRLTKGVILFRIKGHNVDLKKERIRLLLKEFKDKLEGKFVVVSDRKIRFSSVGGLG